MDSVIILTVGYSVNWRVCLCVHCVDLSSVSMLQRRRLRAGLHLLLYDGPIRELYTQSVEVQSDVAR